MKRSLLSTVYAMIAAFSLQAQVTQINNNKSLRVEISLTNGKTILRSLIDSSIWATDGTLAGTIQISPDIKSDGGAGALLSGSELIFGGSTPATGSEIYITDGTVTGTKLVDDIYPGTASSAPGQMASLHGFVYFPASRPAEGRELWRTDGTPGGTTLVADIETGPASSFDTSIFSTNEIFSNGSFLLFAANTTGSGNELWISNGTGAGTVMLKDINTGHSGADSSNPRQFYPFNNMVLFAATDATHGEEIWRTDGTAAGTFMLRDINTGTDSSTYGKVTVDGFTFASPIFSSFHTFNNRAYFNADDGNGTGEIWGTDGSSTPANTFLLKDVLPGTSDSSFLSVIDAENLPNKFIFPVSDLSTRSELWESDGLDGGTTQLFKAFTPVSKGEFPFIYISFNIDFANNTFTQPLFQGNKFFFAAGTSSEGYELWVTDGTLAGTQMVKDINVGTGNGIDLSMSAGYLYTTTTFYFGATDGVAHGDELWKTDGVPLGTGTSMVFDIYPNAGNANPNELSFVSNGKIIFTGTDGDDIVNDPMHTDLYAIDGFFSPLPVKLTDFTVTLKTSDALLQWTTAQELNAKNFTIQRSFDAQHFEDIGIVPAAGTSSNSHAYSFTDAGIINSGKSIVYYRLLSTDIDGKSENSNVISLKLKGNSQWNVRMLSNPVLDNVKVLLSGISGNLQLSIKDINGRTVYSNSYQNINGQISLPVVLQKGVYILDAETNNERKSIKFIK